MRNSSCAAESATDEGVRGLNRLKRKQQPQRKEVSPDNWALKGVEFRGVGLAPREGEGGIYDTWGSTRQAGFKRAGAGGGTSRQHGQPPSFN
jgi:hypothetical protein